jgi:hypothetical protein
MGVAYRLGALPPQLANCLYTLQSGNILEVTYTIRDWPNMFLSPTEPAYHGCSSSLRLCDSFIAGSSANFQVRSDLEFYLPTPSNSILPDPRPDI